MSDRNPRNAELGELFGKLWSRTQKEAGRAARYGRDMLALRQLRADRDTMFVKLGKEVRQLVEAGEVTHPGLIRGTERIKEYEEKIRLAEDAMRAQGLDPDAMATEPTEGSDG